MILMLLAEYLMLLFAKLSIVIVCVEENLDAEGHQMIF